jgi:transketolase
MEIPSIFVFTLDAMGDGEDGPTHQPVEHLISFARSRDSSRCGPATPMILYRRAVSRVRQSFLAEFANSDLKV